MTSTLYNIYVFLRECCEILRFKIWINEEVREAYYRQIRHHSTHYLEVLRVLTVRFHRHLEDLSINGNRELAEARERQREHLRRKAEREASARRGRPTCSNFVLHHKILSCSPEPAVFTPPITPSCTQLVPYSSMSTNLSRCHLIWTYGQPGLQAYPGIHNISSLESDWPELSMFDRYRYYGNDAYDMENYDCGLEGLNSLSSWDLITNGSETVRNNRTFGRANHQRTVQTVQTVTSYSERLIRAIITCIRMFCLTTPLTENDYALARRREAARDHVTVSHVQDTVTIDEYLITTDTETSSQDQSTAHDPAQFKLDQTILQTLRNRYNTPALTIKLNTHVKDTAVRDTDVNTNNQQTQPGAKIVELNSDEDSE